jgi:hypothetical protein
MGAAELKANVTRCLSDKDPCYPIHLLTVSIDVGEPHRIAGLALNDKGGLHGRMR